jgi:DUF4097 and DUF4098 domain-containing protein YvlB
MLKRLATLLLGVGLIGLGVLLFVAPGGHVSLQWLTKLWPIFLILAGLVQVAGHLIDRHPRSPVSGMMIAAVGGILLAANLRGDRSLLLLFGHYWFWLLLAFIMGRVLRQYTYQGATGVRPPAFSAGAIVVMIFLVGGGLASNYLANNRAYLSGVELKLSHMGLFGGEFTVEDESPQILSLSPSQRLLIGDFKGSVEIYAGAQTEPTARLVKHIRAARQEDANQTAKQIHLQTATVGKNLRFSVSAEGVQNDFSGTLILSIPSSATGGVEVAKASGSVKLSGLRGDQVIRDAEHVEIRNAAGRVTIENSRSAELGQIQGEVSVTGVRGNLELRDIIGAIALEARGGNITIEQSSGPVQGRISDAHLEINELAKGSTGTANQPVLKLRDASNSRINLQEIKGAVSINADRSRIEAENITGDLTIKNSSEQVQLNHISGAVKLQAENSTVEIEEVTGAAEIEATRDVTVHGFRGPLSVTTVSGAIDLSTEEKLAGNLKAISERGRIHVSIPEDSDFKLDVASERGHVRVRGFEDLPTPGRQRQFTTERNASANSPTVILHSSRGDVELQSSGLALANRDDGDDESKPQEEAKPAPKSLKPVAKRVER